MGKKLVSVVMGSVSDLPIMEEAIKILEELKISFEVVVTSAHRLPEKTSLYALNASSRGIEVIIAGAGHAAHLAGIIAAHSLLPVIGVPIDSSSLNGIDALLSTVQMPPGIPVAAMAIGRSGAKNAALFAAQILANKYPEIKEKINEYRDRMVAELEEKAKVIEEKYS